MSALSPYLKPGSLYWLKPEISLDIKIKLSGLED